MLRYATQAGKYYPLGILTLFIAWILGQIFRDVTWLTGLCFYIPSPLLAIVLILAGLVAWRNKRRAMAISGWALALFPAVFVLFVENQFHTRAGAQPPADALRLVHWNVFRGHLGWDAVERYLKKLDADIIVLSEFPRDRDIQETAVSLGEGYSTLRMSHMAVMARGGITGAEWHVRESDLKAFSLVWHSTEGDCRVLVADLSSNVLIARDERLSAIKQLIANLNPDIVVGDFNAPRRSRSLTSLPDGYAHAYDSAGSGLSYTWPVPCPVYAIDQCITGPRILAYDYNIGMSLRSDHAWQAMEFTLAGDPEVNTSNGTGSLLHFPEEMCSIQPDRGHSAAIEPPSGGATMGFFSRKPKSGDNTKDNRPPVNWATNAPSHWPKVVSPPLPFEGGMEHPMNTIFFGARISECFEKARFAFKFASMKHDYLTRDGLLGAPLVIQDGTSQVPVFFYADAENNSAAHFEGARRVLISMGEPDPVYYAPRPLEKTQPVNPLREFFLNDLTALEESKLPKGMYSMWWKSSGEPQWVDSTCMKDIDRFVEAVNGYESYFFGFFLQSQEQIKEMGRVALTDELSTFPVTGPENRPLLVSASAEKGIRFHFDKEKTRPYYRDSFLKLAADFAERFRGTLQSMSVPQDDPAGVKPIQWWKTARRAAAQMSAEGQSVDEFGRILD